MIVNISFKGHITVTESGQCSVDLTSKSVIYKKGCGRITTKKLP